MRIDIEQSIPGRFDLWPANVVCAVDDLALKIGFIDHIKVDNAECADPGRGKVQPQR